MSSTIGSGRQTLTAVGVVVVIALLATQTYALVAWMGSRASTGVGQPNGSSTVGNNVITVSGTGQVQIQPDRAVLTMGVVAQATTAESAVQQNADMMNGVISGLEGIGISASNIQTASYSISPQTSCCSGPPAITGYQVTNEVQVTIVASGQTLAQLGAKAGQAIDIAASHGANEVYGIRFTASDRALRQTLQVALQQAVQNASREANVIASAVGVTITGVLSATSGSGYTPPIYYGQVAAFNAATPIVPPQYLTVTATVQVVYSIS